MSKKYVLPAWSGPDSPQSPVPVWEPDEIVRLNLATLNDIVMEVTAAVSVDREFIDLVRDTLTAFTHRLGYLTAYEERN